MPEPSLADLVPHCRWCSWFRLECPACGRRFWDGMFRPLAYSMHYASIHLGIAVFRRPGGG